MIDKNKLAEIVAPLDTQYAGIIRNPRSKVEVILAPFLTKATMYRVTYYLPTRPVVFTFGYTDDGFATLLAGLPQQFVKLAQAGGLNCRTDRDRLAYVTTFLEMTRTFAKTFIIIQSVDEIPARPKLRPQDVERLHQIQDRHHAIVRPPSIHPEGSGWLCTVFAIRDRNLVNIDIQLAEDGKLESHEAILEKDMPVAYGL